MTTLGWIALVSVIILTLSFLVNLKATPLEGESLRGVQKFYNMLSTIPLVISSSVLDVCGVLRLFGIAK